MRHNTCTGGTRADTVIVPSFLALLHLFAPHFTQPTLRSFLTVACGWVLALGRHTVTTVVRTAPFTLFLYSLVVLWYFRTGSTLRSAQPTKAPWFSPNSSPSKTLPASSDMLSALRRASWAQRLFDPSANSATWKKQLRPLLACLDTAA